MPTELHVDPLADAHARSTDGVLADLGTGPDGLSAATAARRLDEYGPNRLPTARRDGPVKRFLSHMTTR